MKLHLNKLFIRTALLLVVGLVMAQSALAGVKVGKVIAVAGSVYAIDSKGEQRALQRRSPVYKADKVVTKVQGKIQFRMSDGTIVSLAPDTEFVINNYSYDKADASKDKSEMSLIEGGFRTITGVVASRSPDSYAVKSGLVVIGVRGTDHFAARKGHEFAAGVAIGGTRLSMPSIDKTFFNLGVDQAFSYAVLFEGRLVGSLIPPPLLASVVHLPLTIKVDDGDDADVEDDAKDDASEVGDAVDAAPDVPDVPDDVLIELPGPGFTDPKLDDPVVQPKIDDPSDITGNPNDSEFFLTSDEIDEMKANIIFGVATLGDEELDAVHDDSEEHDDEHFIAGLATSGADGSPIITDALDVFEVTEADAVLRRGSAPIESDFDVLICSSLCSEKTMDGSIVDATISGDASFPLRWGVWGASADAPAELHQDRNNPALFTAIDRDVFWGTGLPTAESTIDSLSGSRGYSLQGTADTFKISAGIGSSASGFVLGDINGHPIDSASGSLSVNFSDDTASGSFSFSSSDVSGTWSVFLSGAIDDHDGQTIDFTSVTWKLDGSTTGIDGDFASAFTGANAEALLNVFSADDESHANYIEGLMGLSQTVSEE